MWYNKTSRRGFIQVLGKQFLAGTLVYGLAQHACKPAKRYAHIKGAIVGANSKDGHLLRAGSLPLPQRQVEIPVCIVGGGVSGLSAARALTKLGFNDYELFELSGETGGNALSGKNQVCRFPWGAHYLPIANLQNKPILDFLQEAGCITGMKNGVPFYNDYHLCFDPHERLFIKGKWQDGLVPKTGLNAGELKQVSDFFKLMDSYKNLLDEEKKYVFEIPQIKIAPAYHYLDEMSFYDFLKEKQFINDYLFWYLDYCCRDDYGSKLHDTSAFAGIHYFASRRGCAQNAESNALLTWPQGNNFLVEKLEMKGNGKINKNHLAYNIECAPNSKKVWVDFYNTQTKECTRVICNKLINALPQFINKHLLKQQGCRNSQFYNQFEYSPWMVANITCNTAFNQKSSPLCWDNVIFQSESLGYVNACHQLLGNKNGKKVITFYKPLCNKTAKEERQTAMAYTHEQWVNIIVDELEAVHSGIHKSIEHIDVWLWGHGMVKPKKGFMSDPELQKFSLPIENRIFFAHSDLSGFSIFEEAFAQGNRAATEVMESLKTS